MAYRALGRVRKVGFEQTVSAAPDLANVYPIHGRSRALGDDDDESVFTLTGNDVGFVSGLNFLGQPRYERTYVHLRLKMPASVITGHEVPEAILHLGFSGATWNTYSPVSIGVYDARVSVDVPDATWPERDDSANLPWTEPGGALGYDFDSEPVAIREISTVEYNLIKAASVGEGSPYFIAIDVTSAVRRAAKLALTEIVLQLRPNWPPALTGLGGATKQVFTLQDVDARWGYPHTWLEIKHLPPVAFFAIGPDGQIDYTQFLDYLRVDRGARVQLGNPAPGTIGPARIVGCGNTTTSDLTNLVIIRSGAWAETPSRTPSRRELRNLHVYDTVDDKGYVDGTTRLVPMTGAPTTRYQAYLTPTGGTEIATPLTTVLGNTYGEYGRQETFLYAGKKAFIIETEWWGLTPPAIIGDEKWLVEHRADARPSGYTQQAAERTQFTTHSNALLGTANRGIPDDRFWRSTWDATVQQLDSAVYTATVTLDPEGPTSVSHLPVPSVDYFWKVGQTIHIWDADHVEWATIRGKIARTDPTHPDTLILDRQLVHSYGRDAKVTNGVPITTLFKRDFTTLATTPAANATGFDLVEELSANGVLRVINRATPATETHNYTRPDGAARANFSGGETLELAYSAGDPVYRLENGSWTTFFMRLAPPEDALTEQQLDLVRTVRKQTK